MDYKPILSDLQSDLTAVRRKVSDLETEIRGGRNKQAKIESALSHYREKAGYERAEGEAPQKTTPPVVPSGTVPKHVALDLLQVSSRTVVDVILAMLTRKNRIAHFVPETSWI